MADESTTTENSEQNNNTAQDQSTQNQNPDTSGTKDNADVANAAAAAEAAKQQQQPEITDEGFFGELTKRYPTIKGKEDIERALSFNESEYVKPKDANKKELLSRLNDYDGDPQVFLELSKLDTTTMDNKDAIVRDLMVQRKLTKEDAELVFESKYANAFLKDADVGYDPKAKRLAEIELDDAAKLAKERLSAYKVSQLTPQGKKQPTPEEIEAALTQKKQTWDTPIENALNSTKKIDMSLKFKLTDDQEATEQFSYGAENAETKAVIKDLLLDADPEKFVSKFLTRYGAGKTAEEQFKNLTDALYFLEHKHEMLAEAAAFGASKGVAAHIANIRPGNLEKDGTHTTSEKQPVTQAEALVKAINDKMAKRNAKG